MTSTGHMPPWHRVLDEDGDTDTPDSLEAAVRDEIANLWTDLEHEMDFAHDGQWSMACDSLAGRIVRLSRLAGATPWENVPFKVLLDGTYHGLLADAGIEHAEPGENDLRKMRQWLDRQKTAVKREPPPVVVVAPNMPRFLEWCRVNGYNPRDPRLICATRVERLHGLCRYYLVVLGYAPGSEGLEVRARVDWGRECGFILPGLPEVPDAALDECTAQIEWASDYVRDRYGWHRDGQASD